MKRLLLAGVALFGALGVAAATPVQAEPGSLGANAGIVGAIVNPVLELIPSPEGWKQRSICIGNEQVDKAWCLYFPWPN